MSTYDAIPRGQAAASLGSGVGAREVVSWQVSRSLSGGGLPQQARAVSGSSVGSGSVTLVPDSPGESPWSVRATVPGERVSIDAAADIGAPLSPVARMVSRDVSADGWLSPVRTLSVEDEVPRGDVLIPEGVSPNTVDACAVIDQAARGAGYFTTSPPTSATLASWPLVGSLWSEVPGVPPASSAGPVRFGAAGGQAMLVDSTVTADFATDSEASEALAHRIGFTVQREAQSAGWFEVRAFALSTQILAVDYAYPGLRVLTDGDSQVFPVNLDGSPHRVELVRTSAGWDVYFDGEPLGSVSDLSAQTTGLSATVSGEAWLGALSVDLADGPEPFSPTALIAPANSLLEAIAEPTSGDAWDVIQQVAAATLGACWIDEEGRLVYRNRDQLRGGVPQYTIQALDHLEDVPWSISTDEVADRVEFTYRPPTVSIQADDSLTVWQSTETVRVAAGATVRLDRDIDGAASGLAPWFRHEDVGTYPLTRMSRYAAWTAPPGESGSAPPDTALVVSSEMLTPTRIRITIHNTTGAAIWPYELIARARIHVAPGADITISRGLPETKAQRPLQINAGSWVQDGTTAHQIADWLESQSANPLPTIPAVRVIPDASRRLGDVVRVKVDSIGGHEPVVFKALITSIDNSQSAGTYEQRLGLTILGVTFDDWMRWGQARGITTFDQLQSELAHLTTFDALDHWLTDLGGDL